MCECKECGVVKTRSKGVRVGNTRAYAYLDEVGGRWNGRQCPDCRRKEATQRYHDTKTLKEKQGESDLGPAEPLYAAKLRPCRTCKTPNPNYFECDPCRAAKIEPGCLDEDMFSLCTGNAGNLVGFHY